METTMTGVQRRKKILEMLGQSSTPLSGGALGRELSRLGVREAYQNQGIARKLMAGAMEELRRQGFKSVHILVAKENKKALASYKVFEYKTVGACFLHEHDYWCYEKAL